MKQCRETFGIKFLNGHFFRKIDLKIKTKMDQGFEWRKSKSLD